MGWSPRLRRIVKKGQKPYFIAVMKGEEKYYGSDAVEAQVKFAEDFKKHYGEGPPKEDPKLVVEAIVAWQEEFLVSRWYKDALKPFALYARKDLLSGATDGYLIRYHAHLQQAKYKPKYGLPKPYLKKTIIHYMNAADKVMQYAYDKGWIAKKPAKPSLGKPEWNPKGIPADKLEEVFRSFNPAGNRTQRIARFVLETAARPSEVCELKWGDVDWEHGICKAKDSKTRRTTGKWKALFCTQTATEILMTLKREQPSEVDDYIFLNRLRRPFTPSGIRSVLRRAGDYAGVKISGAYMLRHTQAQFLLDRGEDISVVAAYLGHQDLKSVLHYVKQQDNTIRQVAVDQGSPLQNLPSVLPKRQKEKKSRRQSASLSA